MNRITNMSMQRINKDQTLSESPLKILRRERQDAYKHQTEQPDYLENAIKRLENSKPPRRKAIIFW